MYRELAEDLVKAWRAAHREQAASERLTDPEASLLEVLVATKQLVGSLQFLNWEPETLWLTLGNIAPLNRDKLMAAIMIAVEPSFFTNYIAFGHVCEICGNDPPTFGQMPHPSVFGMTWAAVEAQLIYALEREDEPEYTYDVINYVAGVLCTAGYTEAPKTLSFAHDSLVKLLPKKKDGDEPASDRTPSTAAEEVQQKRLEDVDIYLKERVRLAREGLHKLT